MMGGTPTTSRRPSTSSSSSSGCGRGASTSGVGSSTSRGPWSDLVTADPEPARACYAGVFDFTLDRNEVLPDLVFTFLRRPDGHEVGGVVGDPGAPRSEWNTTFEVADTDAVVAAAWASGGGRSGEVQDMVYGRIATLTDRSAPNSP
jgi:predicted enzyme related to lactoylglutathione lyase